MTIPRFIVVEGTDGSGKTTLSKRLHESIPNSVLTHEMSDGVIGKFIRDMFTKKTQPVDRHTMAALFTADRLDHLATVIMPALAEGKTVICDRYYYSTSIYQQLYMWPKDEAWFGGLIQHPVIKPDITIVVSVKPETASARRKTRGGKEQLFEDEKSQRDIWAAYSCLNTYFPNDYIVHVSGEQTPEDVHRDAMEALTRLPMLQPQRSSVRR